ncbi:MAG: MGDG synthase family glycosyltransferase [Armatimonadota bacterium]
MSATIDPALPGRSAEPGSGPAATPARGPRLLILSARFGGGHKTVAEALADWWERHAPGGKVEILDYYDEFVHPFTTLAASVGYTQSVRLLPVAYRIFYETTRDLPPRSPAQHWLNTLGVRALEEHLKNHEYDLIVAVHPTPSGALSFLRQQGLQVPVATVITDYVVHNQWIHNHTDLYLVGSEEVRDGLIRRGVPTDRVRATGIPIRINTGLLEQRELLQEKWGLRSGLPTVLVMTGAQGLMRKPWRLFHTVAARPVQGFFLCGKDRSLMARLKLQSHRYPEFRILPFVRVVPELMAISDILVTKAGGLTTSEALAMELPMIIFHPIPGQEYANRDYLVKAGAAVSVDTMRELGRELDALCAAPGRLARMREATRQIRRPDAAAEAGAEMLKLAHERWRWSKT